MLVRIVPAWYQVVDDFDGTGERGQLSYGNVVISDVEVPHCVLTASCSSGMLMGLAAEIT